ncbi:MAG TPA: glycosyltransferase family 4 protein [Solirubrobacteraceae bacterium]|nr:glycosyltransferase family 4 protein [Solirubrobacteraceae bacterium]
MSAAAHHQPAAVTIVAHDIGGVGGMERQLAELIVGLRRLGHPVTVIAWKCVLPADLGVDIHILRGVRRPFPVGYLWFMAAGTLAVRRHRRGVVQSAGAIVLNRVDVAAIHCCHQVYRAAPRRQTPLFVAYERALGLMKRSFERLFVALNRSALFVCVSEGVADEMRRFYPRAADRVLTIHNGVDAGEFRPGAMHAQARSLRERHGIGDERLVACFVARGWGHKGLGELIEALSSAPAWDLLVAGTGDEQAYRHLAERCGVADRVHWLGVTSEIQTVYEAADAFVLPSSYETFSLVAYEAAASGIPVLATPVNGVRELVSDGRTGFLISRDSGAIAARLNELAADPALRARLGEAARDAALAFSWERMVERHEEVYGSLAA